MKRGTHYTSSSPLEDKGMLTSPILWAWICQRSSVITCPKCVRFQFLLHNGFGLWPSTRLPILMRAMPLTYVTPQTSSVLVPLVLGSHTVTSSLTNSFIFIWINCSLTYSATVPADAVSVFHLTIHDRRYRGTYWLWRLMNEGHKCTCCQYAGESTVSSMVLTSSTSREKNVKSSWRNRRGSPFYHQHPSVNLLCG